jgi:hypothetical protein
METTPGAAELIEAAIESIRTELLPALTGRAAFQARVVLTVLDTARREVVDERALSELVGQQNVKQVCGVIISEPRVHDLDARVIRPCGYPVVERTPG